ncbi:hypothetical protein OUZ56_013983 [Daphnia magna]|uniref:Uncharacterized protein n=1 Tax=Daphnia magna TaxID=35525 RepID=A0ABQ9Z7H8_9CRUS|nr:hypothetical protein OUZ56_013983 [Daphnia magna]
MRKKKNGVNAKNCEAAYESGGNSIGLKVLTGRNGRGPMRQKLRFGSTTEGVEEKKRTNFTLQRIFFFSYPPSMSSLFMFTLSVVKPSPKCNLKKQNKSASGQKYAVGTGQIGIVKHRRMTQNPRDFQKPSNKNYIPKRKKENSRLSL